MLFYYINFSALFRFSAVVFGDYMERLIKIDHVDSIIDAQHEWLKVLQSQRNQQRNPELIRIKAIAGAIPPEHYGMKKAELYNWVPFNVIFDMRKALKAPIYTRGILENEIVFDPDVTDWDAMRAGITKIVEYCEKTGIPVIQGYSGGKGVHLHIFYGNFDATADMVEGLNKYDVDPYKAVRVALFEEIAARAGVDLRSIGADTGKVNFSIYRKGSQIRTFGTARGPGKFKTLVQEVPEKQPEAGELPLIFPSNIETWKIKGTDFEKIAVNAILTAIKAAENASEYSFNDIDFSDTEVMKFPCIMRLHEANLSNGRYYAGNSLLLMSVKCGLSKEETEAGLRDLYKTFPNMTDGEVNQYIGNTLTMYGRRDLKFSCKTVKETHGKEFCDFKNCPMNEKIKEARRNKEDEEATESKKSAEQAISKSELNGDNTKKNLETAKEIIETHLLGISTADAEELILFDIKDKFGFNSAALGILKKHYKEKKIKRERKEEEAKKSAPDEENRSIYVCKDEEGKAKQEIIEAEKKAREIMEKGDPVQYILDTVNAMHTGDEKTQEGIAVSIAGQSCLNTAGIQVSVNGESGSGKSHGVKSHFHLLPDCWKLETSLSSKAAYYLDLAPGVVIFSDDTDPSEDMEEVIKRATTNYQTETTHTTVKDQECKQLTIPPRINWFLTSVESDVSDQLLNRQITFSTDESAQQKNNIFNLQVIEEMEGEIMSLKVDERVLICRRIYAEIKTKLFNVKIPFAERFELRDKKNPRIFKMFADMVKGYAIFNFMQRGRDDNGHILAEIDDFTRAKKLFESQQESVVSKLSSRERDILRYINENPNCGFNEIARNTGMTYQTVRNTIIGRSDRKNGGMLGKVRGLERVEQMAPTGLEGEGAKKKEIIFRTSEKINIFDLYDGEFISLRD